MTRNDLLNTLGKAGLSPYEARCYLALLEKETLTVSEISQLADVPRTNAYGALEKLLAKGICVSRPGRQKQFSAVSPGSVRDHLYRMAEEKAAAGFAEVKLREREIKARVTSEREEASSLFQTLDPLFQNRLQKTDPLDYIEVIKDPKQAHRRYLELVEKTEQELLVLAKPPFSGTKEDLLRQEELVKRQMQQGLKLRSVYEIPEDEEMRSWLFAIIERVARAGAGARVTPRLPLKACIFDSHSVMLTLEGPVSGRTSLTTQVVEHHALAESLRILFETLWLEADEFTGPTEA